MHEIDDGSWFMQMQRMDGVGIRVGDKDFGKRE
jgi:hypothetical protein